MNSIIKFTFSNFRSFLDEAELNFVAHKRISDVAKDQKAAFQANEDLKLLHSMAVYGPNASGKSNVVKALAFMQRFVVESAVRQEEDIPVEKFLLSKDNADPSSFELTFIVDSIIYRYGFKVTTERVHEEWLYQVVEGKEKKLFSRKADKIAVTQKNFPEGQSRVEYTRPNALFLSVVANLNGKVAASIRSWFLKRIRIMSGIRDIAYTTYTLRQCRDPKHSQEVQHLIASADIGIKGISIEASRMEDRLPKNMPERIRATLLEISDKEEYVAKTVHHILDEQGKIVGDTTFSMEAQESEGTQLFFAMSGPILETLRNGGVLIIDEFGVRLHSLLAASIIKLFHSQSNNNHAQLLFVTHDSSLLSNDTLRRDQVWFVEKDARQCSHLHSLLEYGPRGDSALEKNYLQGRYGAIPLIDQLIVDRG